MKIISLRKVALILAAVLILPVISACSPTDEVRDTSQTTALTSTAPATTASAQKPATPDAATQTPSLENAQIALNAFIKNFAKNANTLAWTKTPYNRSQFFWTNAEIFEVIVDYAGVLDTEKYDKYVKSAYTCFKSVHGDYNTWASNAFNDDLMWMVIGTAKAYLYTGDEEYKKCASTVFNYTFERAWTSSYGGGLVWQEGVTSKNSCVNYPGTIAACLLYKIFGDGTKIRMVDYPAGETESKEVTYLEAAQKIYAWSRNVFRMNDPNDPNYGKVYDNIDAGSDGKINTGYWDGTYNQGTFIGSAALLYELTGDSAYLEDAKATFHYVSQVKYRNTVVNDECNGDDLPGFKGIMMRWICYFIKNHYDEISSDMEKEMAWVTKNLTGAWRHRNSKNIIWTAWNTKTNDTMKNIKVTGDDGADCYSCWGCSAALSLLINYPYDLLPVS